MTISFFIQTEHRSKHGKDKEFPARNSNNIVVSGTGFLKIRSKVTDLENTK